MSLPLIVVGGLCLCSLVLGFLMVEVGGPLSFFFFLLFLPFIFMDGISFPCCFGFPVSMIHERQFSNTMDQVHDFALDFGCKTSES